MGFLKKLGTDTAIYGLSSIVGRFLNYLLVPLYTAKMAAATGGYGIVTHVYGYTALLLVLLTYGMETTLFRFLNKEGEDPGKVYTTILATVGVTSLAFVACVFGFMGQIAPAMGYADHPAYIGSMCVVVALDAFQAIMFSYLRAKKRPYKFAALKLLFIFLNIGLNWLFFVTFPDNYENHKELLGWFYDPTVGVGYAFYINLFCTSVVTFGFWKEIFGVKWAYDWGLLKRMLSYTWPLLVLGIAGILNQTADKIIFPFIYPGGAVAAKVPLGIYGAAVKIAMIMALITQAFRYAYEPLIFDKSSREDNNKMQVLGMKYFVIFTLAAFLAVMAGLDVLKYLIGESYREGLVVVPIVMAAEIMMGIYFNLSFWYKLTDRTIWGAVISGIGCLVLLSVNIIFVPTHSYMACAWGGVAGYGTAMLLSYFLGQHYLPIKYPLKELGLYVALTAALYAAGVLVKIDNEILATLYRTVLFAIFMAVIVVREGILAAVMRRLKRG
ncbi:oligosaccharide flippase family protein [Sodaliphilus sp.]|uniref:oligosaccharide flippase family protein n=1 Tax=Sodaliphilus sp. TaxID=2815818 RepID=UPI003890BD55